jgi:hypothetical protein
MSEDEKFYGKVTLGYPTQPRDVNVVDYIQSIFKDHRLITIMELEDGSYTLSVENPESTGRASSSKMLLSKESFIGLICASHFYWSCKQKDIGEMMKDCVVGENINYVYSENLAPINFTEPAEK